MSELGRQRTQNRVRAERHASEIESRFRIMADVAPVLLWMAVNERLFGTPRYGHDFPGLALESVHWLADRGIGMFGVEAVSPAPEAHIS